ncbi:hypothetical protein [Antrihabitans spumae]|uniref:Uncharacterized protein n=1 Tax=Antrihabitans spumae TaxID=3373370 RepID=A0ABW7JXZ7_9NOCA
MSWIVIVLKPAGLGGGAVFAVSALVAVIAGPVIAVSSGYESILVWALVIAMVLVTIGLGHHFVKTQREAALRPIRITGSWPRNTTGDAVRGFGSALGTALVVALGMILLWGVVWYFAESMQFFSTTTTGECEFENSSYC